MEIKEGIYSILEDFKKLYGDKVKSDIVSINIIQSEEDVFLESIEKKSLQDEMEKTSIKKDNLNHLINKKKLGDGSLEFSTKDSIKQNSIKFLSSISEKELREILGLLDK